MENVVVNRRIIIKYNFRERKCRWGGFKRFELQPNVRAFLKTIANFRVQCKGVNSFDELHSAQRVKKSDALYKLLNKL